MNFPPFSETHKSQISRHFRESPAIFRASPYFPPRPLRPSWSCWCTAPGLCSHWAVAACNHRCQVTVLSLKLQRHKKLCKLHRYRYRCIKKNHFLIFLPIQPCICLLIWPVAMCLVSNSAPVPYPHLYLILYILLSVVRHILVEGDMSKYGAPICTRPAFGRITYFGALVFCPHIYPIKLSVVEGILMKNCWFLCSCRILFLPVSY